MIESSANGYLLHKQDLRETSLYLTFFTKEYGLLICTYRGGKKAKNYRLLQLFQPTLLSIRQTRINNYLNHLENNYLNGDPMQKEALFIGLYLNELLFYALTPNEPHQDLFSCYQRTLTAIKKNDKLANQIALRNFERQLLISVGFDYSFVKEAYSNNPIESEKCYQFIAGEGFKEAASGLSGKTILALDKQEFVDKQALKTMKIIMRQAIYDLLGGKVLKSRDLFKRL